MDYIDGYYWKEEHNRERKTRTSNTTIDACFCSFDDEAAAVSARTDNELVPV